MTFFCFLNLLIEQLRTYAIRDAEEYKNFCDRSKDLRPQPEEVIGVRFQAYQNHNLLWK